MNLSQKLQNVRYRLERTFHGERGIVLKVEPAPTMIFTEDGTKHFPNYLKDDFLNLPDLLTFQNPLGEIRTALSRTEIVTFPKFAGNAVYFRRYKQYQPGKSYP